MNKISTFLRNRTRILLVILFSLSALPAHPQVYVYFYRVYFRDKGTYSPTGFTATQLLSPRAIERREKSGIEVPDYRDLPVYDKYINQVSALGFRLHSTSKWMNTALFKTTRPADINPLLSLPCVSDVKLVMNNIAKSRFDDKLDFETEIAETPPWDRQITMVNGYASHNAGYDGTGILIAVLDGGFNNADKASSLALLRSRGGIKDTYDFVNRNKFVYGYHTHGTAVLSVLAGQISGAIRGTAPDADYLLLRTEETTSENLVEEDFWAAGAEFADSAGADIISSSLGYYEFDDANMNHKFGEMDGNTTFISKVADIAASKGILVVNSVGNERNKTWLRIIAPADGDSVMAVGAVDGNNYISSFSSAGPSADRQVKPDVSALGVSIVVQASETQLSRSSGTSFSCPVLSGMSACLMEAVPDANNIQIIEALQSSADKFSLPDSLYGYGIPDMAKAMEYLQDKYLPRPEQGAVAGPNPTMGEIEFIFRDDPGVVSMEIVAPTGRTIHRKDYLHFAGRSLRVDALKNMEQGIYFIRLITNNGTFKYKIVKLNN